MVRSGWTLSAAPPCWRATAGARCRPAAERLHGDQDWFCRVAGHHRQIYIALLVRDLPGAAAVRADLLVRSAGTNPRGRRRHGQPAPAPACAGRRRPAHHDRRTGADRGDRWPAGHLLGAEPARGLDRRHSILVWIPLMITALVLFIGRDTLPRSAAGRFGFATGRDVAFLRGRRALLFFSPSPPARCSTGGAVDSGFVVVCFNL
ncbi:hypothetical protein HBB16_12820 [Pseudonocardia sp. MCCB 268]|nr:hypothetical protein [Pseudonocardia cytotoxica]